MKWIVGICFSFIGETKNQGRSNRRYYTQLNYKFRNFWIKKHILWLLFFIYLCTNQGFLSVNTVNTYQGFCQFVIFLSGRSFCVLYNRPISDAHCKHNSDNLWCLLYRTNHIKSVFCCCDMRLFLFFVFKFSALYFWRPNFEIRH